MEIPINHVYPPPQPTDILSIPAAKLDEILQMNMLIGEKQCIEENIFIGAAIKADNTATIQDAYLKLRLIHPQARHIMCAYQLQVEPEDRNIHTQDFCDDGEIGAGRQLLKLLQESDLQNRAIFVVRYCGEKLGPNRYRRILNAAKRALLNDPDIEEVPNLRVQNTLPRPPPSSQETSDDESQYQQPRKRQFNTYRASSSQRRRTAGRRGGNTGRYNTRPIRGYNRDPRDGRNQRGPSHQTGTKRSRIDSPPRNYNFSEPHAINHRNIDVD